MRRKTTTVFNESLRLESRLNYISKRIRHFVSLPKLAFDGSDVHKELICRTRALQMSGCVFVSIRSKMFRKLAVSVVCVF